MLRPGWKTFFLLNGQLTYGMSYKAAPDHPYFKTTFLQYIILENAWLTFLNWIEEAGCSKICVERRIKIIIIIQKFVW